MECPLCKNEARRLVRFDAVLMCEMCQREKWHKRIWTKRRNEILKRDNYTCQKFGEKGCQDLRLEVHHIIPRRYGGTDLPENLITFCFDCHRKKF